MPCRLPKYQCTRSLARRRACILRSLQHEATNTSSSVPGTLRQVPELPSWEQGDFLDRAYRPGLPYRLPRSKQHLPPACSKWFVHDGLRDLDLKADCTGDEQIYVPTASELRPSFWQQHESITVPLELTFRSSTKIPQATQAVDADADTDGAQHGFQRLEEAPLHFLLSYLSNTALGPATTPGRDSSSHDDHVASQSMLYLAQCELSSLPASLQRDVPTPSLIASEPTLDKRRDPLSRSAAGGIHIKGDIYGSSLWLGRPPTYTPLHRDPNPNLFVQLAGQKHVRLLAPEAGDALFAEIQARLSSFDSNSSSRTHPRHSAAIRGEEMMAGAERSLFHDVVWFSMEEYSAAPPPAQPATSETETGIPRAEMNQYKDFVARHAIEATLGLGHALFIPKGWWHSVRGVGPGLTASANWWFR